MNIDFLKEKSRAMELTEGTEVIDIAVTDEIINAVIEQKQYSSLAYQIAEVSPIHGPTAGTFALAYIDGKIQLLRGNVSVEDDAIEDTGFTMEAIQDLYTQYGKSMIGYIGRSFAGVSSMNENRKLISKLSLWAGSEPSITLTDPKNAETSVFEIQQRVAEIVMKINSSTYKSLDSFVVLPAKAAASMLAVSNRLPDNKREYGLFLGSNSRTDFYLNPDVDSTECFVGIKSPIPGQSSVLFSPYMHLIKTAINPKTGNENVFNFNRYAIAESRLSEEQKMLYKFEIMNMGSIPNVIPIANAGPDGAIAVNGTYTLDGSASTDPDNTGALTYKWQLIGIPTGSTATIVSDTAVNATFTPDVVGTYTLQLVVGDGYAYSAADTMQLVVS